MFCQAFEELIVNLTAFLFFPSFRMTDWIRIDQTFPNISVDIFAFSNVA